MSDASRAGKCWYLIYAKPRQEKTAVDNLLRQAYEVYFPQIQVTRNRNSVRKVTIEPLFPRYLFIRLDAHTDNWAPIRSTLGVTALVRFGAEPARVPDAFVDYLKSRQNAEGLHEWAQPALQIGSRARVVSGPLAGYEGILVTKSSRERVILLMDMVGTQVRTQLSPDQIEPVAQ